VTQAPGATPATGDDGRRPALVRPSERYGDDRRSWRPLGIVAVIGLAIVFVGGIVAIGWNLSNPAITVQLRAYNVVDDRTVEVTYLLRISDTSKGATCVVRARDRQGIEVGRTNSVTPAGKAEQIIQVQLKTSARAVLGEVLDCRATS